jgi:tetratricopeptide (TPR) repeat protein
MMQDIRSLLTDAMTLFGRGDLAGAETASHAILARAPDEPNALMFLGLIRGQQGRRQEALDLLSRAYTGAPTNPHILNGMGICHKALGNPRAAIDAYRAAIAIDRQIPPIHLNLGRALELVGDMSEAAQCYRRAVQLKPDYDEAFGALALVLESRQRFEEARGAALRAKSLHPNQAAANIVLARTALQSGNADEVLELIPGVIQSGEVSRSDQAILWGLIGRACESKKRFDQAFDAFTRSNDLQFSLHHAQFQAGAGTATPKLLDDLQAYFTGGGRIQEVNDLAADGARTPIFMVGFPRSGTTLLDQALASHPEIETLEEVDTLVDAIAALVSAGSAASFFGSLDGPTLSQFRQAYWERVKHALGRLPERTVFIDKMPINTVYLGLTAALFPQAKIIFSIRDPRDVVLSCFKQQFGMNHPMFQFLKLEGAAKYYGQVMRLAETYRASLRLSIYDVRYESLVSDFDVTVRGLLSFLGLTWDDAVRDYEVTARTRQIRTPSASQVIKPLYTSSIGRWRDYEKQLEPVLPVLEPWAKRYGYE